MKFTKSLLKTSAAVALVASAQAAMAGGHGEITVGYFLEWPMPFEYAKQMGTYDEEMGCLLYTSPSPRDRTRSRMPSSA